jgi:hypothetical protein
VIEVDPVTTTLVAEKLPVDSATPRTSGTKVTVAPTSNPVPVRVTDVFPVVEPNGGLMAETVGTNGENVNTGVLDPTALVYDVGEDRLVGIVTVTKYDPATVTPGDTAVITLEALTVTLLAGNSTRGLL